MEYGCMCGWEVRDIDGKSRSFLGGVDKEGRSERQWEEWRKW